MPKVSFTHNLRRHIACESGSVWLTNDRGDAWSLVTANLPPINVVRFAGA